ncbi:MAG TPA: hypothetical protein VNW99_08260 [Cytophagaceae bacterium]|jgi:hypothetical protein|nr:hypothetical protein [Cytophagaceae bacterium]
MRRSRIITDDEKFYEVLKDEIQESVREAVSELLLELKPLLGGMPEKEKTNSIAITSTERVSTSEVKRRWGKSRTTIRKCCKEQSIRPAGKFGRQFLYSFDDMVKIFGHPIH